MPSDEQVKTMKVESETCVCTPKTEHFVQRSDVYKSEHSQNKSAAANANAQICANKRRLLFQAEVSLDMHSRNVMEQMCP